MTRSKFIIGWLVLILAATACGLPASTPPEALPEPQSFESLETAIVETAAAAQTQTATVLPTSTFTPTATRTATITPTPTPTFLYIFMTDTPTATPETPTPGIKTPSSGSKEEEEEEESNKQRPTKTDKPWTCLGVGKTPPNYTVFQPGTVFTVTWTILNTGTKSWTVNTIDFVYTSGFRHENTKIQDLTRNLGPGDTVNVSATFIAPKKPGEYNTYFTLQVGKQKFCGMRNVFIVPEPKK